MPDALDLSIRIVKRAAVPMVPRRMCLPLRCALHMLERDCETELKYLDRIVPRGGAAVDAGANAGYYAYRLSRLCTHVYAFEANEDVMGDLRAYAARNIEIFPYALSDRIGTAKLYIPVVGGHALDGWASLSRGNCPEADVLDVREVMLTRLDMLRLDRLSFIKIDVEGHELEVLSGAALTLARDRPVILVESKAANLAATTEFLRHLGYARLRLEEIVGVPGSPDNWIFRPSQPAQAGTWASGALG